MKTLSIVLFALFISGLTQSYSQNSPEIILDKFFSQIKLGKYQEAVESLPVNSIIAGDTSFTTQMISKLNENQKLLGEYCGYELIGQNEVSESYIISDYLIKYLNAPRRIQFIFYMPVDNWQVNRVTLNTRQKQSNASRTSRRF